MKNPCLDEGILQGYYDSELDAETLEYVATHLSSCAACVELAREVESEMELANAAFATELSLSVPTERLRSRLDEAIAGLQTQPAAVISDGTATRVRAWFASLAASFNLTPQRAMGFASIALFLVLAAVVGGIIMRQRDAQDDFVAVKGTQGEQGNINFVGQETPDKPEAVEAGEPRVASKRKPTRKDKPATPDSTEGDIAAAPQVLPGEKDYLQAISSLTEAIEANGESSLQPTLLADYKRNLAVVDHAITATQRTARTNPNSADAAEMLYSIYQSKLDLLSAVAEQSRPLVAQR
jgi:hypothetical protein